MKEGNQMKHYEQRVKETRKSIRKHLLEQIFHEFDVETLRLSEEGRQEKYRKMVESPFRFFRGSAYLFYFDHANMPSPYHTAEDAPIWIQGDLHMDNFGAFQNENGDIVYDINDFDEGYIGSYLYDILRMSISIVLYTEEEGYTNEEQNRFVRQYIEGYVKQLKRFVSGKDDPMTLIFTRHNTRGPIKRVLKKLEQRKENHLLQDITTVDENGKRQFIESEEIERVTNDEAIKIQAVANDYYSSLDERDQRTIIFYHLHDIVRKYGTGTASIGLKRYYALVEGARDAAGREDLVLEIKEVRAAIPAYFLQYREDFWARYSHQGHRVVATQKAMHHLEDPYLGYLTIDDEQFYVRERSPYKKKVKQKNYKSIEDYDKTLAIMGAITAKNHSRAGIALNDIVPSRSEEEILDAIRDVEQFIDYVSLHAHYYATQVYEDYNIFAEVITNEEFMEEK